MRNYCIFLRKELFEAVKTYKLLIMGAVLLFFAMLSPLTAKYTPEIIKWAIEIDPAMGGMDLSSLITEPVAFDSWAQFYGNIGFVGLIVLVIVFSGMLASEISSGTSGTLTIMLSKGLSRSAVILSKLTSAVIIWTVCYALSFLTAWGYTAYMFKDKVPNLFFAIFCLWVFGVFLLAATALMATVTRKGYVCMLLVGGIALLLTVIDFIPQVKKYNPISLLTTSIMLLNNEMTPRAFYPVLAVTAIGIVAFTLLAVILFNKKGTANKAAFVAAAVAVSMALIVFLGEEVPQKISVSRHIVSEEVIIGAGTEWELNGMLTLPQNVQGKIPGVVLVHGSGANDMDETIFDNKPFRDIAEHLSKNGIAVLRYNMRTLTHWNKLPDNLTVWEEKIEDALFATEMLKSDPRIDEGRVFILGHSLGGMIAPRIHNAGGDYAGLILFAGSPRWLFDISGDQVAALVEATEDEDEKAAILGERGLMEEEWETIREMSDEGVKNTHFKHFGELALYWKDLYDNPIERDIQKVTVPFLVMHPDDDVQVLTDVDFAMYKEILAGRDNVTFKLYSGLNHLFMPSRGFGIENIMDEYRIKSNVDPQVLADIVEWIMG
jgi:hypothetical protein